MDGFVGFGGFRGKGEALSFGKNLHLRREHEVASLFRDEFALHDRNEKTGVVIKRGLHGTCGVGLGAGIEAE